MKVLLDDNGFIISFAMIGDLVNGIDLPMPDNMSHFLAHFLSYKISNGVAIFDEEHEQALQYDAAVEEYRQRRAIECFPIINRGQFWYDTLTDEQKSELCLWYHDWLDGTPTQTIPEKPMWLK